MKTFQLIFSLLLFGCLVNGQGCLPEGIEFMWQEDIDNF